MYILIIVKTLHQNLYKYLCMMWIAMGETKGDKARSIHKQVYWTKTPIENVIWYISSKCVRQFFLPYKYLFDGYIQYLNTENHILNIPIANRNRIDRIALDRGIIDLQSNVNLKRLISIRLVIRLCEKQKLNYNKFCNLRQSVIFFHLIWPWWEMAIRVLFALCARCTLPTL